MEDNSLKGAVLERPVLLLRMSGEHRLWFVYHCEQS
ncbi:unnamed protein product [Anisakis simplex]|uniref:Uncharacterized protein n=1 Tax=Anisakis simplex TaxID=6269 RepID=A0A3P6NCI9_ANISI|nr:unnamed protein product [Anisakis simplex]